jgi:hypothetical protein
VLKPAFYHVWFLSSCDGLMQFDGGGHDKVIPFGEAMFHRDNMQRPHKLKGASHVSILLLAQVEVDCANSGKCGSINIPNLLGQGLSAFPKIPDR